MPGLVRFFPQSYMQTEDLLKSVNLDIKKKINKKIWNYSKAKQHTKTKLCFPFGLIILDKDMELISNTFPFVPHYDISMFSKNYHA